MAKILFLYAIINSRIQFGLISDVYGTKKAGCFNGRIKIGTTKNGAPGAPRNKKKYFQKILALKISNYLIKNNSPLNLKLNSAFFDVWYFLKYKLGPKKCILGQKYFFFTI